MSERIHDDEPDTGADVVEALLADQCPEWSGCPIDYLATSGTDNAMWRIRLDGEPDLVVRLPRRPGSAAGAEREIALLQELERTTLGAAIATPRVRHVGVATQVFPHPWSILEWIDGEDAWTARSTLEPSAAALAADLAATVTTLRGLSPSGLVERAPGSRGGPLAPVLDRVDEWLDDPAWNAESLVDVPAVRRIVGQAKELTNEPVTSSFVHGDLIPGNLLIDQGRLAAVIDWGGAGRGDIAQDLAPAWAILDGADRHAFRDAVEVDEVTWIRGRAIELEHAVGGVLYYVPRRHVLGEIMERTLGRIIADAELNPTTAPNEINYVSAMDFTALQPEIERLWENRDNVSPSSNAADIATVTSVLAGLDQGALRVAERTDSGEWITHQWLKQAVLLGFRIREMEPQSGGPQGSAWWDKVDSKFDGWNADDFTNAGFRAVPNAVVRRSAYVAPGAVLMPSFVNVGAYVGERTMVDTWATVGSCAQIGDDVHLSGGVGIGGVLEPLQASPTIIEDNCFIGARSEVVEGVIVREGSVLAMGTFLSQSTKIFNRETSEVTYGEIPRYSVVVSGSLPSTNGVHLYCAVIVKQVDARTRSKTSINDLLRD